MAKQEPFDGDPPAVATGDRVLARNVTGRWIEMVALAPPRYDHEKAIGRTVWLSVPLALPEAWARLGAKAEYMNWPAEDVRPFDPSTGETTDHG